MSRYLLDTTVLIAHLRGEEQATGFLLDLLAAGQTLGTCCVNVAEIERGLRPGERKKAETLLGRLEFYATTQEAATRAGRYQADFSKKGRTIHAPDALIAGTARAHDAILVTDNRADFPMRDLRVEAIPDA